MDNDKRLDKANEDYSATEDEPSPLVSIIVPTYNRGEFIGEMIESVICQTYKNWELIIVDDGSTDDTEAVVKPYISDRIHYYRLEHTGRSFARNYALHLATGAFIAYLDSDDLFLPKKLEKQVRWLLDHPNTAMVYTSALIINDEGDFINFMYHAVDSGNIYEKVSMYIPVIITLPSVMVRKEVQDKVGGFDTDLDRFEDTDMWRRISRDYWIDGMAEPLIKARTHCDNRLENLNPAIMFVQIKKYIEKAHKEDGELYKSFLNQASSRLLMHYGQAVSTVSGWDSWERKFYQEAETYQPFSKFANVLETTFDSMEENSIFRQFVIFSRNYLIPPGIFLFLRKIWRKITGKE